MILLSILYYPDLIDIAGLYTILQMQCWRFVLYFTVALVIPLFDASLLQNVLFL